MKTLKCLVAGCGYLGQRVASRWAEAGFDVFATTRSTERASQFASAGWTPVVADLAQAVPALPRFDCVLCAVGYDRSASPSQRDVYVGGLSRLLAALPEAPGRIIYVSSTGVYGQNFDEWVDESSSCVPTRAGGQICLEAEQLLRAHRFGERSIILRLAGIYGPGRVPHLEKLQRGQPLSVATHGYLNLIHVADAVRIVDACLAIEPPELFLVADNKPVERKTYYDCIGRLLGVKVNYETALGDDARSERSASSKRVRNRKILDRLRLQLQYPTCGDGLRAILNNEGR